MILPPFGKGNPRSCLLRGVQAPGPPSANSLVWRRPWGTNSRSPWPRRRACRTPAPVRAARGRGAPEPLQHPPGWELHASISPPVPDVSLRPGDCVAGPGRADPAASPSSLPFIKGEEEERRPSLTTFSSSAGKGTWNRRRSPLPGDALHHLGAGARHHLRRHGRLELIPRRPPGK